MRDLEELLRGIRDRTSRTHFEEATRAYQSGAYRAAVVETWVAVCVDLIDKLRFLADSGDGAAARDIELLNKAIENGDVAKMQQFENKLLDTCSKHGLITPREEHELKRIYEDRNLCAHPAFTSDDAVFSPKAELVRAHFATAVDDVLARPPIVGRRLVEKFCREIDSDSWPDASHLTDYLRNEYFTNARDSVRRSVAEVVVKGAIEPPESQTGRSSGELAGRCRAAIMSLVEIDPGLLERVVENVVTKRDRAGALSDSALTRFVGALGRLPMAWRVVGDGPKTRILALLRNRDLASLLGDELFCSGIPSDPDVAKEYAAVVRRTGEDFEQLRSLVEDGSVEKSQWVRPALLALRDSGSFRSAEARLRLVLRLADYLREEDLADLAESVRSNRQISAASDAPTLLENLYRETRLHAGASTIWLALTESLREQFAEGIHGSRDYYSEAYDKLFALVKQA